MIRVDLRVAIRTDRNNKAQKNIVEKTKLIPVSTIIHTLVSLGVMDSL